MASNIIQRYLYDMSNARRMLMDHRCSERRLMAKVIIDDVLNYFVEHIDDVADARRSIVLRGDPECLQMLDLIDEFMSNFVKACEQTNAALKSFN